MASGAGNMWSISAVGVVMLATGLFVGWWIPKDSGGTNRASGVDFGVNAKVQVEPDEPVVRERNSGESARPVVANPSRSKESSGELNRCPLCPELPTCDECPTCLACPDSSSVCADYVVRQEGLTRKLKERNQRLKKLEKRVAGLPEGSDPDRKRYIETTAGERRTAAAAGDNLLLEFPAWGEDTALGPELMEELGLAPEEANRLADLYRGFSEETFGGLQDIYSEMMGDPDAGADSTVNGLFHNIASQSTGDECKQQMALLVSALSVGAALIPPSSDAHPCARAFYLLISGVDSLEGEVRQEFGEAGVAGLWHGTSSFVFSTDSKKNE